MTYDQWETSYPCEDHPEDECYHEHREIDWSGYATCDRCGKGWFASAEEIAMERELNANYDAFMRREERMDRYWRPLRRFFLRCLVWMTPRKPKPIDDDLPF